MSGIDSEPAPLSLSPRWLAEAPSLRERFEQADPYPHLVLDDFLAPDLADGLVQEFPPLDAMPRSKDYLFADKRELSSIERNGPASRRYHDMVLSPGFRTFLRDATGLDLVVDPMFFGGGFHQGGDGSFLELHVDFNVHPMQPTWERQLNILVYLNPDWRESYGGELLLKRDPQAEPRMVAPLFNRAVIMATGDSTYHGYRKMQLPPGVTRRSVAAYAYREVDGPIAVRTTGWVPENAGPLKRFAARHYGRAVLLKNRLLGSGTARNR